MTVSLKNEVSVDKIEFTGDYQIFETVNGRPSWKGGDHGIWYVPIVNKWLIGYWNKFGEDDGEFYASNDYGSLTDNRNIWKYTADNGSWITPSDSNDVIISSSGGKESKWVHKKYQV